MERLVQSYSIKDIRNKILNKISLVNRKEIVEQINIENLYSKLSINEYSIDSKKNDCYIGIIDFAHLICYINLQNNSNISLDIFKSILIPKDSFKKINNKEESLKLDLQLNNILLIPSLNEKISNIFKNKIKTGKTIISFDFSFNIEEDIVDVGISYYNGKIQKNYHYLVKENRPNIIPENSNYLSFHFGETQIKEYSKIISILSIFIQQADVILLHDSSNDLKLLEKMNLTKFITKQQIIDTSLLFKVKDNKLMVQKTSTRISLKNLLRYSNISYSNLHNSGNDAFYTLKLFLKNFHKIKKYIFPNF